MSTLTVAARATAQSVSALWAWMSKRTVQLRLLILGVLLVSAWGTYEWGMIVHNGESLKALAYTASIEAGIVILMSIVAEYWEHRPIVFIIVLLFIVAASGAASVVSVDNTFYEKLSNATDVSPIMKAFKDYWGLRVAASFVYGGLNSLVIGAFTWLAHALKEPKTRKAKVRIEQRKPATAQLPGPVQTVNVTVQAGARAEVQQLEVPKTLALDEHMHRILAVVSQEPKITQAELGNKVSMSRATVGRRVQSLIGNGYLEKGEQGYVVRTEVKT